MLPGPAVSRNALEHRSAKAVQRYTLPLRFRPTRLAKRIRVLSMVYAADAALRQEELDMLLAAAPATGWGEAVAKARYLLILFAQTPAAEDPRRATLIADVFADFKQLLAESNTPAAGDAEKGKAQDRATAQAPFGFTRPETGIRQLNPPEMLTVLTHREIIPRRPDWDLD